MQGATNHAKKTDPPNVRSANLYTRACCLSIPARRSFHSIRPGRLESGVRRADPEAFGGWKRRLFQHVRCDPQVRSRISMAQALVPVTATACPVTRVWMLPKRFGPQAYGNSLPSHCHTNRIPRSWLRECR